jgi:hypothetical protein
MISTRAAGTMEVGCLKCGRGTFGEFSAAHYSQADKRNGAEHPCQPCKNGTFQDQIGQSTCKQCREGRSLVVPAGSALVPSCDGIGASFPLASNTSKFPTQPEHRWDIIVEPVYEANWRAAGMDIHMTESSLQFYILVWSLLVVIFISVVFQVFNCLAKAQLTDSKAWITMKEWIKGVDAFEEEHLRYVGERQTMVGGFSTAMFQLTSWSLVVVVFYLFASYNAEVFQSLLPRTEG